MMLPIAALWMTSFYIRSWPHDLLKPLFTSANFPRWLPCNVNFLFTSVSMNSNRERKLLSVELKITWIQITFLYLNKSPKHAPNVSKLQCEGQRHDSTSSDGQGLRRLFWLCGGRLLVDVTAFSSLSNRLFSSCELCPVLRSSARFSE